MKKLFILIFIVTLSSSQLFPQITGLETPPPADPSCYTTLQGCASWSDWTDWKTIIYPTELDGCTQCSIYVNYKTRYCSSDPSIVEMWIGAFGIDLMIGCPCPASSSALLSDPTKWQMISYRKIAYAEFESVKMQNCCSEGDPPCCNNIGVMNYSMRWPGSCTMKCIYADTPEEGPNPSKWVVSGDYACYPSGFCCGKTYILCYNCETGIINEQNQITIGEGHNCNYPTNDCPDNLCPEPDGINWFKRGCTQCTDNCNYANQ